MAGVPIADRKPLNAVKYSAKDFRSVFDSLMRRLKTEFGADYNDFASTTQGVMLIDLMAYAVDQLLWYMDRTVSDCYLDTARTRTAINRLVKQIGYKMRPAVAATADLAVTFDPAIPSPAQLRAGFRFAGPNGLTFEAVSTQFLATGTTALTVPVQEGTSRLITYTGDGTRNQRFRLQGADAGEGVWVAEGSVRVWVDGAEWEERDFLDYERSNHFEVDYLAEPPAVQCGDGVAGNVPPAGAEVKLTYVLVHGKGGMASAGSIASAIDVLVVGGQEITLTVTNPLGASGGDDPEDAERARKLAPYSFAARGAAITQQDYQAQVNGFADPRFGRVAKGYAVNVRSAVEDAVLIALFEQIEAYLDNYQAAVASIESTAQTDAADITAGASAVSSEITQVTALRTGTLSPQAAAVRTNAQAIVLEAAKQVGGTVSTQTICDAMEAYRAATYPSDTDLRDWIAQVKALATNLGVQAATIGGAASGVDGAAQTIQTALDSAEAGADSLYNHEVAMALETAGMVATAANLTATLAPLPGSAAALNANVMATVADVSTYTSDLFDADCKANYVQVPIVSVNADGDYVAPASGLIHGLQTYLEGIKEVTQIVSVVDGSAMLVPVDITVDVGVVTSYVAADVLSDVEGALVDLLRGRDFNTPLRVQTVHDTIRAASKGVNWANVQIAAPTHPDFVDAAGNVVTGASYIITRGTLLVREAS